MLKFDDKIYGPTQFRRRPKNVYRAYAQAVLAVFRPSSIIDLGCANGYALEYWQKHKIKIAGVEPAAAAFNFMPRSVKAKVRPLDLRQPQALSRYGLVNFTEVAEHLEPRYESAMLQNVASAVKNYLVISWSNEAGSPEHVNPRPPLYVKFRLRRLGLFFEPELTEELKRQLAGPVFADWRHWQKNILVFSRTPAGKRVLVRHWQWLESYANKNIGYFLDACRQAGLAPRRGSRLFGRWHRVWIYPFERHLLFKLLILKLWGNRTILKLDSQRLPWWRAQLIKPLVYRVLAESARVARPFGAGPKLVHFSGGLPRRNLEIIKNLKIKREKIILYSGRPVYQKGFDRLKKIIPAGWRLKIVSDLSGRAYYTAVRQSSIVVLPTRGEGWPNVFQDAFYCRRLFLTTEGAQCGEAILDKTFYCPNSVAGLRRALKKITANIDTYYRNFDKLYSARFFQTTDPFFSALLK